MPVIGVNLSKIDALKNVVTKGGKININNNFLIKDVQEGEFAGDSSRRTMRFDFGFTCNYDPELGKIMLEGSVLFVDKAKSVQDWKKQWEKEKSLPTEVMQQVMNTALHKCNVQAIKISEDLSLPPPIYLPRVRSAEETKDNS